MGKAVIAIAVVAVVALAGAGAAIFFFTQDKTPTATILIEDQNGVYFWAEGKGETVADACAKTSAGVTITMTDSSFGKYISEINGLKEDYTTDTCYWGVYYLDGDKWVSSDVGVSSLKVSEHSTIGLFYLVTDYTTYAIKEGGPDKVTVPKVEDKKVWNGSTDGTVFAIKGISGLYFYINSAAGETMTERFTAATSDYKIPFEVSKYGGIGTLFGIGTVKVTEEKSFYWAQFGLVDGAWAYMSTGMKSTTANDYKQFAIVYGDGGMGTTSTPLPPIYKA